MAMFGRPWALGAQAVTLAFPNAGKAAMMNLALPVQGNALRFSVRFVEEADVDARRVTREYGDRGATFVQGHAELVNHVQVMTDGAERPVRVSISARLRAIWMRSESAVCVSPPCFAGSGS